MKRFFILQLFVLPFLLSVAFSQQNVHNVQQVLNKDNQNFYEIRDAMDQSWDHYPDTLKRGGWKQFKRWEYFWTMRTYPNGEFPNPDIIVNEFNEAQKERKRNESMLSTHKWKLLGPISSPVSVGGVREQGIGRVNRIRINPKNSDELWAGTASGGVWKSTDKGATWKSMDFTSFLSLGVSDIAISPTDPKIVYVATGDIEPAYSKAFYTIGLIKTTDGGDSWQITGYDATIDQGRQVGTVLVHPENPDIVIIGTNSGIEKSTDGGATWDKKYFTGYFTDMEFMPGNPDVVYGSTISYSGNATIFVSKDGGDTWKSAITINGALRIALAVSEDEPDFLFSLNASASTRGFHSYYVSSDQGDTWEWQTTINDVPNILGWYRGTGSDQSGQGSYDLALAVSPANVEVAYSGGINIWKTSTLGFNWDLTSHWFGGFNQPYVHADIHDLVFSRKGDALYAAHDGGLDVSFDNGASWNFISIGISNTQYYRIGSAQTEPEIIYGGSQDNGTSRYYNGEWQHIYAGDGMECAVDPTDHNRVYVSMYYGNFARSINGGLNFDDMINENVTGTKGAWVTPLVVSQSDPNMIFAGYDEVWMSENYGTAGTWKKISNFNISSKLYSMAVAPSDPDHIYACTLGTIHYTYDGGQTWSKMPTPSGAISYITVDPNNPKRFWVTISSYNENNKVYEWNRDEFINLSGNLPNVPVNCIAYQKDSPDRLFIGNDLGVYYTDYGSGIWERYGTDLPNVVVNDLEIHETENLLRAGTYGRGVWEIDLLNCNLPSPQVTVTGETDFCEGDEATLEAEEGYASYLWTNGETTRSITVTETGNYAVTVDDGGECKARSELIEINVWEVPDLSVITRGDNPFCQGDSVQLSGGFGFEDYRWSNGETGRSIYVKEPGEYILTAFTENGCEGTAEPVVLEMIPTVKPKVTQSDNKLISSEADNYQWYLNDKEMEGENSQEVIVKEIGTYRVAVTDENGCEVMSDPIEISSDVEDSIDDGQFLGIHPNPNKGSFRLEVMLPEATEFDISVVNLIGMTVYEESRYYENGILALDMNLKGVPAGVYFVNIKYGSATLVKKLVIE
jgi:photosystem II stability/assembly factor-like uncharacterized protein